MRTESPSSASTGMRKAFRRVQVPPVDNCFRIPGLVAHDLCVRDGTLSVGSDARTCKWVDARHPIDPRSGLALDHRVEDRTISGVCQLERSAARRDLKWI